MLKTINNILTNYVSSITNSKENSFSKHHPMFQLIQNIFPSKVQAIIKDNIHYKVEGSVGKGQWTETPWLSIFSKKITKTATKGIYLVYLFKSDMSGFYLSLNQGATYLKEHFRGKGEIQELTSRLRSQLQHEYPNTRFVQNIELSTNKNTNAKGYEQAHLLGFEYKFEQLPTEVQLINDLLYFLDIYKDIEKKWLIDQDSIAEFYRGVLKTNTVEEAAQSIYFDEENYQKESISRIVTGVASPLGLKSRTQVQKIRTWARNPAIAAYALRKADYLCEIDSSHATFKLSEGQNYMEGHHLIPVHKQDHPKLKDYALDSVANIVSLCPNCHRAIHYGNSHLKKNMLSQLYLLKYTQLIEGNINIQLNDLYEFYGI